MNDTRYVIISTSDVDKINFYEIMQTSPASLRLSLDGSQAIVKYKGDQPKFIYTMTQDTIGLTEYAHDEILEILNNSQWSNQY